MIARTIRRLRARRLKTLDDRYADDPRAYWDLRHDLYGDSARAVGFIGGDEQANAEDYELKRSAIAGVLDLIPIGAPAVALDAGCGKGMFTDLLLARYAPVEVADFSSTALEQTRATYGDRISRYQHAPLSDLTGGPYALVLCADVLFHVVDDNEWRRSVERLASLVRPGGYLVIQEHLVDDAERRLSGHVRWRSATDYALALPDLDLVGATRYALLREDSWKDISWYVRPE